MSGKSLPTLRTPEPADCVVPEGSSRPPSDVTTNRNGQLPYGEVCGQQTGEGIFFEVGDVTDVLNNSQNPINNAPLLTTENVNAAEQNVANNSSADGLAPTLPNYVTGNSQQSQTANSIVGTFTLPGLNDLIVQCAFQPEFRRDLLTNMIKNGPEGIVKDPAFLELQQLLVGDTAAFLTKFGAGFLQLVVLFNDAGRAEGGNEEAITNLANRVNVNAMPINASQDAIPVGEFPVSSLTSTTSQTQENDGLNEAANNNTLPLIVSAPLAQGNEGPDFVKDPESNEVPDLDQPGCSKTFKVLSKSPNALVAETTTQGVPSDGVLKSVFHFVNHERNVQKMGLKLFKKMFSIEECKRLFFKHRNDDLLFDAGRIDLYKRILALLIRKKNKLKVISQRSVSLHLKKLGTKLELKKEDWDKVQPCLTSFVSRQKK